MPRHKKTTTPRRNVSLQIPFSSIKLTVVSDMENCFESLGKVILEMLARDHIPLGYNELTIHYKDAIIPDGNDSSIAFILSPGGSNLSITFFPPFLEHPGRPMIDYIIDEINANTPFTQTK